MRPFIEMKNYRFDYRYTFFCYAKHPCFTFGSRFAELGLMWIQGPIVWINVLSASLYHEFNPIMHQWWVA